jgi:hypothetical protein
MQSKPYASPYIAGVALGLVLLLSFFITGQGLGASGAFQRVIVAAEKAVSPEHVDTNEYLSHYGGGKTNPLSNWLVFEVIGVLIGGILSGSIAGRMRLETNHGPGISPPQRWALAAAGGALFGFGSKLARGCTSGVALTGGATLSLGSWAAMIAIFAGAYATAWFVRRFWI